MSSFQIILGVDLFHHFPEEIDRDHLWTPYASRYPGIRWKTSKLTGEGLLEGWTTQSNPLERFRDLYGTKNEEGVRHLETLDSHLRIQKNRVWRALQRSLTFLNRQWRYNSQVASFLKVMRIPNYDLLASVIDEAMFTTNKTGWEKTTIRGLVHNVEPSYYWQGEIFKEKILPLLEELANQASRGKGNLEPSNRLTCH